MFRQLFEEGLELQKVRLREQRAYAREQHLEHQKRHQDQITSMENYYKDQVGHTFKREVSYASIRKSHTHKLYITMCSYMLSLSVFTTSWKTCTRASGDPVSEKSSRKGRTFTYYCCELGLSLFYLKFKVLFNISKHTVQLLETIQENI